MAKDIKDMDVTKAMCSEQMVPKCCYAIVKVKLGSMCLEAFLANVKNFMTFLRWDEETELFHLHASQRGPMGQLLWDLGPDITLDELTCLHGPSRAILDGTANLEVQDR